MPLNSDEINYLVYRYLLESGFDHSAFVFLSETALHDRCIGGQHVERGALIRFLHKGLQYQSLEYHITKDGASQSCFAPFNPLKKHICTYVQSSQSQSDLPPAKKARSLSNKIEKRSTPETKPDIQDSPSEDVQLEYRSQRPPQNDSKSIPLLQTPAFPPDYDLKGYSEPPKKDKLQKKHNPTVILDSQVTVLKGTGTAFRISQCSWNPTDSHTIALGGGKAVYIWKISSSPNSLDPQLHVNLRHDNPPGYEPLESVEVNSLQWTPTGALLATGASDGSTWLWSRSGVRIFNSRKHSGPITNMEWNVKGDLIATTGVDCKIIIWNMTTFSSIQQIELYDVPVLSLDWLDNKTFAISYINSNFTQVCRVGSNSATKVLSHKCDVNKVIWNRSRGLLASCSDDATLKFWSAESDHCVWTAVGHEDKVNSCQWCPKRNINLVASAASDGTARMWDVSKKKCVLVLNHSYMDVSCLNFSPDGKLLATCTENGIATIWSVDSGKMLNIFDAKLQIFEAKWNGTGKKLALTLCNSTIVVLDFPS